MSDEPKSAVPPPRYRDGEGHHRLIMDEQEWLARPAAWGIDKLPDEIRGRKWNLFNAHCCCWLAQFIECAACRSHVRELFTEVGLRVPAALALSAGNNLRDAREQLRARYLALHPTGNCDTEPIIRCICHYECGVVTQTELFNKIVDSLNGLIDQLGRRDRTTRYHQDRQEMARSLALELVGPNPFRPIAFSPSWLTGTVVYLAAQMYESRDFSAMPILADALQDSGCDNDAILNHCRDTNAPHARGCWVVDLVLGKQ